MDSENEPPLSSPDTRQTTQNLPSSPPADRTKSGRTTRKPELFSQGTHSNATPRAKRKRPDTGERDDEAVEEDDEQTEDASDSEMDDENQADADEEELRERKRAARKTFSKKKSTSVSKEQSKSRTAKKPKIAATNGIGNQRLAVRQASNGQRKQTASRTRKPKVRPSLAAGTWEKS